MGRTYDSLEGRLGDFVLAQPVFFVATAPLAAEGHVNCSPKGNDGCLAVLGPGRVALPGQDEWDDLAARFPDRLGMRSVIVVDAERISDSCGYAVPLMPFQDHRSNLDHWAAQKGPDGLVAYRAEKNAVSLDGLAALPTGGTTS